MKIFVFDTETTGFIQKKETDLNKQPHIVQFAGILGELKNGEYKELERINQLIKIPIPIPYPSSKVHHIYDVDIKDSPPVKTVIDKFLHYINTSDLLIAHNIEYDEEMMKIELKRMDRLHEYNPKQTLCTMKTTVDFAAIQGNGKRFKYPKLGELYKKLFGEYFIGAHDAMVDVEATVKVLLELSKQGVLKLEKKENNLMTLF